MKTVVMKQLKIEVIVQVGNIEDGSLLVSLACDVQALYMVDISIRVKFLKTTAGMEANFFASTEVNVGLGKLKVSLEANAAVGDYLNPTGDARALAILNNEEARSLSSANLLDADWDLSFKCDWETAQWLKDLGAAIFKGLKVIGEAIAQVWNGITGSVAQTWDAIKILAAAIGGAIADLFDSLGEALDAAQDTIANGIEAATNFLEGKGAVGELAAGALEIVGDVLDFTLDRFGDVLDLVCLLAL